MRQRWPLNRAGLIDVGLTALVLAFTLVMFGERGLGTPEPSTRPLDAGGVLLAFVATLPLLVRRRFPALAYAVTSGASLLLLTLGYPLDVPAGPALAGYNLAAATGGDTPVWRRWAAMLAVAAFVPLSVASLTVTEDLVTLVPELTAWIVIIAFVWVAGDRSRLRRERIAALEERARRIEREAEARRRLAAAQERTRIARELHDSAGHAINVILVQAGAARLLWDRDPIASQRAIGTIEDVARETIDEIDRLVRALREDEGLQPPAPADAEALADLVERHREAGLRVTADVRGNRRPLPSGVAWAAYRILQEALTNAVRHGAGGAEVVVGYGPDAVELTVANPVHPGAGGGAGGGVGGLGVVGMRERVALLGGSLTVTPGPASFRLHARLPYAEPRQSAAARLAGAAPAVHAAAPGAP
jgi:signal transduction histidine kinase